MKLLVAGMGKSGYAAARLALDRGHDVLALDAAPRERLVPDPAPLEARGLVLQAGADMPASWSGIGTVILSPGWPRASALVRGALAAGIPVVGELEWALSGVPGRVAAVTGANGKSTTTTLLGELLGAHFPDVRTGGNLGTAAADLVDGATPQTWFVLEASSFQLESLCAFRADVALLLNITPDHQDRYPRYEDYQEAKGNVFLNQRAGDWAIFNGADPLAAAQAGRSAGCRLPFALADGGSDGAFVSGGRALLRRDGREEPLFDLADLPLPGAHNLENALAACAAARCAGVPAVALREALRRFRGLPHRLEKVGVVRGASVFNDSKATNTDAVLKALTAFETGVVLLLGGKDKGADWASLVPEVTRRCRAVVAFGKARPAVEETFRGRIALSGFDTLREATPAALALAGPGDTVLLSPACASFDEFKNFEDRGDQFRRWVQREAG